MVPPNETYRQSLASPRAWCPGPGTGTWQLVATSYVPLKDAYDARPLTKTATSAKWLYVAVTVLPEHSRWTSCKPQDSESVTNLCAIDSTRTAAQALASHINIVTSYSCITVCVFIWFTATGYGNCHRLLSIWISLSLVIMLYTFVISSSLKIKLLTYLLHEPSQQTTSTWSHSHSGTP